MLFASLHKGIFIFKLPLSFIVMREIINSKTV